MIKPGDKFRFINEEFRFKVLTIGRVYVVEEVTENAVRFHNERHELQSWALQAFPYGENKKTIYWERVGKERKLPSWF